MDSRCKISCVSNVFSIITNLIDISSPKCFLVRFVGHQHKIESVNFIFCIKRLFNNEFESFTLHKVRKLVTNVLFNNLSVHERDNTCTLKLIKCNRD